MGAVSLCDTCLVELCGWIHFPVTMKAVVEATIFRQPLILKEHPKIALLFIIIF